MCACARWLLLAALPALAGVWVVTEGEVVTASVGGGPRFLPRQETAVLRARGQTAELHCAVAHLGDKAVSWVRSAELQILSHAGAVFTADARVSAPVAAPAVARAAVSRHTLRIERLRPADSGTYECQLNTDPKMSLFFNLTVVDEEVPRVVVLVRRAAVRGASGGAATLACEARLEPAPRALPPPPLDVRWTRRDGAADRPLQRARVALDTERWAARVESRLTLAELVPGDAAAGGDAGDYRCAVGDVAGTVTLSVDDATGAEAMQRDQSASGATTPGLQRLLLLPALLLARLPRR